MAAFSIAPTSLPTAGKCEHKTDPEERPPLWCTRFWNFESSFTLYDDYHDRHPRNGSAPCLDDALLRRALQDLDRTPQKPRHYDDFHDRGVLNYALCLPTAPGTSGTGPARGRFI
jgi:hypothetical protein